MSKYFYLLLLLALASMLTAQGVDMAALSLYGSFYPNVSTPNEYIFTIRNDGANTTNYTVALMRVGSTTALVTLPGVAIAQGELNEFHFNWTPATLGEVQIYGKINLENDEFPGDNETNPILVTVIPAGVEAFQIFDPNSESETQNFPVNYYYRNSLTQTIYLENELPDSGVINNIIYGFKGSEANNIPTGQTVRIYLGTTPAPAFYYGISWVTMDNLQLVFEGTLPVVNVHGAKLINIPLQTEFTYEGGENLVVMVHRLWIPDDTYYTGYNWVTSMTSGNRTLRAQSDGDIIDPHQLWPSGSLEQEVPFTIFLMATNTDDDMSADLLAGKLYPTVNVSNSYTVTVTNQGGSATSAYTVSLMQEGNNTPLVTVDGTNLAPDASRNFILNWTPTTQQEFRIYARVNPESDAFLSNNQTNTIIGQVLPSNKSSAQIYNPASTFGWKNVPFNYYYANGVSQTIYLQSEIPQRGNITSLVYQFNYLNYTTDSDIPAGVPVQVFMANTSASYFATENSWIPTSSFTQVYSGTLPVNGVQTTKNIEIPITPFSYQGGNLVVMTYRPWQEPDGNWYSNYEWIASEFGTDRTIADASDGERLNLSNFRESKPVLAVPLTIFVFDGASAEGDVVNTPRVNQLMPNYPNPFNPTTTISFYNASNGHVQVEVFNILGQKVKTLIDDNLSTGTHSTVWNGDDQLGKSVGSGVYFYKMTTEGYTETKKMLLMK